MKTPFAACLLLLSSLALAAPNKWVDAEGKVHYSDAPPPSSARTLPLEQRSSTTSTRDARGATLEERELARRKARLQQEKQAEDARAQEEAAAVKRKNCEEARAALDRMDGGGRLVTTDERGERVYLDEDMIRQRRQELQQIISENCS